MRRSNCCRRPHFRQWLLREKDCMHQPKYQTQKAIASVALLVVIVMGLMWFGKWIENTPNARAYNDHVCAVYGYQSDCKTPLEDN